MAKQITYKFWLTFDEKGGSPKATKSQPNTTMKERSMFVSVSLPESVFKTPQLSATITMNENSVKAKHLDVTMIEAAISGAIDGNVTVTILDQPSSN